MASMKPREAMPAGEYAPELLTVLSSGTPFDLSSQLANGGPVLVTFWASWCPACRAEAPALEAAYQKLANAGGTAIGMVVDQRSLPAAQRLGMTFPQALASREDMDRFGVELLPTTFVIDREGRIAGSFVGEATRRQLDAVIDPLIAP